MSNGWSWLFPRPKGFAFCERTFLIEADADPALASFFANEIVTFKSFKPTDGPFTAEELSRLAIQTGLVSNVIGEPTSTIFRKMSWVELGGFSPYMSQFVDWEYWLRIGTAKGSFFVAESLCTFRVHGTSTTTRNRVKERLVLPCDMIALCRSITKSPAYARFRNAPRAVTFANRLSMSFVSMLKGTDPSDWPEPFTRLLHDDQNLKVVLTSWLSSKSRHYFAQLRARLWDRIAIIRGRT